MRRNLAILAVAVPMLSIAAPAHAEDVRVCVIRHGAFNADGTMQYNVWRFVRSDLTTGTWEQEIRGRECYGALGAPSSITIGGTYTGNPCSGAVLHEGSGGASGSILMGVAQTHAGPGGGYTSIDGISGLTWNGGVCNPLTSNTATALSIQNHVTP